MGNQFDNNRCFDSYHGSIYFAPAAEVKADPTAPRSRAEWIDRFTMEVGRLSPDSDPVQVAAEAAIEVDEACGMGPEEAAAVFMSDYPE